MPHLTVSPSSLPLALTSLHQQAERSLSAHGLTARSCRTGQLRATVQLGGQSAVMGLLALPGEHGPHLSISLVSAEPVSQGLNVGHRLRQGDFAYELDDDGNLWMEYECTLSDHTGEAMTDHVGRAIDQMELALQHFGAPAARPRLQA